MDLRPKIKIKTEDDFMSFQSSDATFEVPYTPSDCFTAMKQAAKTLPKFKLKSETPAAGMLQYSVSAGMTSFTWGDIVNIVMTALENGGTKVSITSTAKVPSVLASVTESKNIQTITNAFIKELENYQQAAAPAPAQDGQNPADEIKKYKQLLDMGAITQEEYEAKKKQLLNL
jgi:hypothetical protein